MPVSLHCGTKRITATRLGVAPTVASMLIGGGAGPIHDLRGQFESCRIRILDAQQAGEFRVLTVSGPQPEQQGAVQAVLEVVSALGSGPPAAALIIDNKQTGALIGQGGRTISKLRQALPAHCSIRIEKHPAALDAAFRTTVHLSTSTTAELWCLFLQVLSQCQLQQHTGMPEHSSSTTAGSSSASSSGEAVGFPAGASAASPTRTDTPCVAIPTAAVGAVIGRGGRSINAIRQATGCGIKLAQKDSGGVRLAYLSGTQQQQAAATAALQSSIQNALQATARAHTVSQTIHKQAQRQQGIQ